ncbi:MAG: hypothetical protein AABZ12_12885 [Planctomycetota bacterium]
MAKTGANGRSGETTKTAALGSVTITLPIGVPPTEGYQATFRSFRRVDLELKDKEAKALAHLAYGIGAVWIGDRRVISNAMVVEHLLRQVAEALSR